MIALLMIPPLPFSACLYSIRKMRSRDVDHPGRTCWARGAVRTRTPVLSQHLILCT
jgi:hypothetical protein